MKRLSIVVAALLLGLVVAVPTVQAAPEATAFTGEWVGQDPAPPDGDGSTVHLSISGGDHPRVVFTDEFGTVCVNAGSPVTYFASLLRGTVDGDALFAVFNVAKCGPVTITFLIGEQAFYFLDDQNNADPADDTLFDGSVVWHRV